MNNLFSFLHDSAKNYPDKIYVIDKVLKWTYSDIYEKTGILAEHMLSCGIKPGDRVLIYFDNSAQYITAFFSVLRVNGIVVPINKNTTIENMKYIFKDTSPKIILSNEIFLKRIFGNIELGSCEVMDIDKFWNVSATDNSLKIGEPTENCDLPAMILYTSGTTKAPKGVTLTHKNLKSNTESILKYLQLTKEDSILATINFSYSYGNSILLTHTKIGGTIIIENRIAYPKKIIEQIYESQVTGFSTVGSYINLLLKQDSLESLHLQFLKYVTFAGESTNFEDIIKLNSMAPHIKIFVMYGQTEGSARLSYLEPSMLFKKAGSIGKGIPGVILRVVTDEGQDVDPGEIGEIIATGDNIMKGYWNNDKDTGAVLKDRYLYTGDLATVDEDGYIYVKGRKDDIIKHLGHRISPVEIEAVINSSEYVLESAVIGLDNGDVKQIKAYIVLKEVAAELEEINAHIKKFLPAFKRPNIIEFVNELPRTANGKIKRSELRKKDA